MAASDQHGAAPASGTPAAKRAPGRRIDIFICILLCLATVAVYWQTAGHDFILLDDPLYVTDNPRVQAGLTFDSICWAFTADNPTGNWHPLTWLSHMLDCELFGMDPFAAISEGTLIATCRPHRADEVQARIEDRGIPVSQVGEIVPAEHGLTWYENGRGRPLEHPETDPFWGAFARASAD